ncbi:MAG: tetratricopeptide repeat protein [Acidobacteria bacterium]|nr:tetratricopeptide repeat protein [Acidobacteriota bacterium]NIM63297.1 tetratricopeptide repeat protein [Acidobacteriota bacterium]NIO59144.1 tetratricopeptide repeat protein [Acidobacteriota bacterium]NIQ30176.1 tetratricopeptide repeat protein [Acidobacteriota bacterium]NIQ85044.1 tetratricopeptide repeat protein [Acidobacteriota bacterium]
MEHNGIQGQVYNTNRLGGFYMYHFYPDRLPFSDGRWEVYGNAFFEERRRALADYAAWREWVAGYGVRVALLHHTSGESRMLVPALYNDPDWSLVYYDFAASLFVKTDAVGRSTPITFSASSRILDADVRPDSRFILSAFYRNLGLDRLLLDNLERVLPTGHNARNVLLEMAGIHLRRSEFAEAEQRFHQVLEIDDHQTDALRDLAFITYNGGRYDEALAYSSRAVESNPGSVDLRFNHALILVAMGREADAREQLNTLLKIDPGYTKARQLLERM